MADYALPSVVEKRVRYFDGQFLQDQDFIDEQNYQLDREHRHNRLLHGPGIADGLTVTSTAPNQVTVAPGTAVDADGYQLVLAAQATTVDLTNFSNMQGVELYISYQQSAEDPQPQTVGGSGDLTRWLERPQLKALAPGQPWSDSAPPVLLAKLALDNSGHVQVDNTVRAYSGLLLPGSGADAATLRATSSGPVELAGSLTVDGNVGIGTHAPAAKLHVSGGAVQLDGNQQLLFTDTDLSNNLKVQLWTGYGLGINGGTLFYAAGQRHSWRDASGANERMALTTGADGGLTVSGTGASTFAGSVGIGTSPAYPLHLAVGKALRIEGGTVGTAYFSFGGNGAFSIDAPNVPGGRFMVQDSGNVGIGTASPRAKLEVAGTAVLNALQIGSVTIGENELNILSKLASGKLQFDFLNLFHNEYAYAASDGFNYDSSRRRIFTWIGDASGRNGTVGQGRWQIVNPG